MKINKLLSTATLESVGMRIDKYVGLLPQIGSRSRAEQLIEQGAVKVGGVCQRSSYKIKNGDLIEIEIPEPPSLDLIPLHLPIDVLLEDEDLIVLNKPAGVVMHPSAGHEQDTLVNMLIAHTPTLSMGFGELRPGIVHRLDRDTSGVLVVAKNDWTHRELSQLFKIRDLHRVYHAITMRCPTLHSGKIESWLARHPTDRKRFASVRDSSSKIIRDPEITQEHAKWAATQYEVLSLVSSGLSYIKLKLETGRTHQIRVHLSELGCPIVGDTLYGADKKISSLRSGSVRSLVEQFPRFALHAKELGFRHPRTKENLFFSVNWPQDLWPLIKKLEFPNLSQILQDPE